MPQHIGSRVAVVTGGTAGVGRAVVRRLAADGYDIAVLARGTAGLAGASADVEAAGRKALAVPTDVSDARAVEAAADLAERELGPVTVWVNAAFAGFLAPFWDVSPEEYRRVTDVTYHGQVNGTRLARDWRTSIWRGRVCAHSRPTGPSRCAPPTSSRRGTRRATRVRAAPSEHRRTSATRSAGRATTARPCWAPRQR